MPITAVMAGEAGWRELAKLHGATLVANLVSGWLFTWRPAAAGTTSRATSRHALPSRSRVAIGAGCGIQTLKLTEGVALVAA